MSHLEPVLAAQAVLIIEDDEFMARLLAFILTRQGGVVEICRDGADAMALLSEECRWDAVLLDLMLPRCSGLEILRAMRSRPGWRDVTVLVVSALDKGEEIARAFHAGADDFTTKPFNPDELIARLARRLSTRGA
ncbi:MAG: hypothetical protein RIT26_97 [Pseudomonadota bacterium]|jgi:DNA-binding response OmpR family regulator